MAEKRLATCILIVGTVWLAAVAPAGAADSGFYVGVTAGQTSFDLTRYGIDRALESMLESDPRFELPLVDTPFDGPLDTNDASFSGLIGYRINRGFSVEVAYLDLGGVTYSASGTAVRFVDDVLVPAAFTADVSIDVAGAAISVVANILPPKRWELFVRGGVFLADVSPTIRATTELPEGSFTGDPGPGSESSTDTLFGAGVAFHVTDRWAARLEYERFLSVGGSALPIDDVELVNLGLLMRF